MPFAGDAERLARETGSDAIHDSTPRAAVEGGKIRPHRRLIQGAFFHAARQYLAAVGFPLQVADDSRRWKREPQSEVETSDARTQGKDVEGREIHTTKHPRSAALIGVRNSRGVGKSFVSAGANPHKNPHTPPER